MDSPVLERFIDNTPGEISVRGYLHLASPQSGDVLVLTHGAGGNCQTPLLIDGATVFAEFGLNVLRCDLPFRQARPKGPPSPSNAERDQQGLRRAVTLMRQRFGGRIYLGGQSYGGRQASILAASEPDLVSGLLLLSYPLHPPGRPAQMRTAHFPRLRTPALFVHGTTDPFASSEELDSAVRLIPARTRIIEVVGGHTLTTKQNRKELPGLIVQAFEKMLGADDKCETPRH